MLAPGSDVRALGVPLEEKFFLFFSLLLPSYFNGVPGDMHARNILGGKSFIIFSRKKIRVTYMLEKIILDILEN
jgi:hypothetical protein